MCRLLGFVARRPRPVVDVVGADVLDEFVALGRVHCDGWGLAWRADGSVHVHTSSGSALDELVPFASGLVTDAAVLHLRWASAGLAVEPANLHPFSGQGAAFAHNGTIWPPDALDALLAAEPGPPVPRRGSTDSERYFALVQHGLLAGLSAPDAARRALALIRPHYRRASLNALLLTPDALVAIAAGDGAALERRWVDHCVLRGVEGEHNEIFYTLRTAQVGDAVLVGSTGFGALAWQALPDETVTALSTTLVR